MSDRHKASAALPTPVIRKLIRREDTFICSICRSEYDNSLEANTCLNHCWFDLKHFYPVILRRGPRHTLIFRCHFCCRNYADEGEALSCARACLGERNKSHIREQLLNDLPLEAPPKRPSRVRLAITRSSPSKILGKEKVEETNSAVPSPDDSDVPVSAESPAPTEVVENKEVLINEKSGRRKDSFSKPWVRHDAKYKCNCCNSMYFTRMEAEACFDKHFDAEGYEMESASSPANVGPA